MHSCFDYLPLQCSHEMQVHLDYVPPPKELEKALAARFIMTMASSPPDKSTIKMFFYGQHVSELSLIPKPSLVFVLTTLCGSGRVKLGVISLTSQNFHTERGGHVVAIKLSPWQIVVVTNEIHALCQLHLLS